MILIKKIILYSNHQAIILAFKIYRKNKNCSKTNRILIHIIEVEISANMIINKMRDKVRLLKKFILESSNQQLKINNEPKTNNADKIVVNLDIRKSKIKDQKPSIPLKK
jgi:hypothetical protein